MEYLVPKSLITLKLQLPLDPLFHYSTIPLFQYSSGDEVPRAI
jgi:hypothetical protein